MAIEVKVPVLGESVSEASVGAWLKQPGEAVAVDEAIVTLETDKVAVDVPSPWPESSARIWLRWAIR